MPTIANPTIPSTTPPPVNPLNAQPGDTFSTYEARVNPPPTPQAGPTAAQQGLGNPTGDGNYGPTNSNPYGWSTVTGTDGKSQIVQNTAPTLSTSYGTNEQGVPYGNSTDTTTSSPAD